MARVSGSDGHSLKEIGSPWPKTAQGEVPGIAATPAEHKGAEGGCWSSGSSKASQGKEAQVPLLLGLIEHRENEKRERKSEIERLGSFADG